jgi:hypothetical protein
MLHVGIVLTFLGALLGAATADAQAPPPTPVSVGAPASTVPTVTPPPATATPTTAPVAGSRGGADEGSAVKPSHETWDVRRIVITTALAVIALAAVGYVYGKIRSTPPKHPDLGRQPEDLEITG